MLGRRGFALESAVARICREAGARVSTNVFVRDLDLIAPNVMDERRREVVAEGLPLHGGAQLVIDTTLVSALRRDGAPRPSAATTDGVALQAARRRKNALTGNLWVLAPALSWWCWRARSQDFGLQKL